MAAQQTSKPLNHRSIEAMKPNDPDKSDAGEFRGLRVACGSTKKKTFYYRYKSPITKKLVQVKIGNFPEMSLSTARNELHRLKSVRQEGRCPAAELKSLKAEIAVLDEQKKNHVVFNIEALVEFYLTQYIEDRKSKTGQIISGARKRKGQIEIRRMLHADVVNVIGDKLASEVSRKDLVDLIMGITNRGSKVQAGNVLRELKAAYELAIGLGKLSENCINPALLARESIKQAGIKLTSEKGRRVLSEVELKKLLAWLPGSAYSQTQKNVLRFALWTGCRTGEVCSAEWKDIDLDKGVFHIHDSKNGAERYVQLPKQAVEFMRMLRLSSGDYPFASQRTRLPIQQKQLSEQAWRLRESDRMLDIKPWTAHDLRRTVRTGLARLQCPNHIAEAVLGHSRKGIEGTYDLHSYETECKEWLQKWADYLDTLIQ